MKHLWDAKHDYYCEGQNYFSNKDTGARYESFEAFLAAEGDSDKDYNLLFRWDWEATDDGDGILKLYTMLQRKGYHREIRIRVTDKDEATVIAYLQPHLEHLLKLWAPIQIEPSIVKWAKSK